MGGLNSLEHSKRVIRQSLEVGSTPHRAWQAWAEPAHVVDWFCDEASGGCLPGDEISWRFNGFEGELRYRVERSWPGRELLYLFEMAGAARLIEIVFEASGQGTFVTVVHSGLPEGEQFDELARGINSGWANALQYLRLYLTEFPGRGKRTSVAQAHGDFDYAAAMQWFEPGLKRERWLDVPAEELQPGWRSERHFVWRWPAIEGTLEMNVFQGIAGQPTLALRAVSWSPNPVAGLDQRLAACVDRLSKLLVS